MYNTYMNIPKHMVFVNNILSNLWLEIRVLQQQGNVQNEITFS